MAQSTTVRPDAFDLSGGPTGILLIHGFTGSAAEMRLIAEYLNARDVTATAPLLPGHGTTPGDMNTCKWTDWTEAAESALAELQRRCTVVFVAGLSMGALLALHLAARQPGLAGAIAYAPAVRIRGWGIHFTPVAKHFLGPRPKGSDCDLDNPAAEALIWSYDENPPAAGHELRKLQRHTVRLLPKLRCPILVIYSRADRVIHANAGPYTYENAGSEEKELIVLQRSGHVITVDSEWETVAEKSYEFILKHTPTPL